MPPEFATAYDALNPADDDYRFYAAVADQVRATRILDLGCGTGRFAHHVARPGRQVIGIDPDPAMLAVAQSTPSHEVEWRLGDSASTPVGWADLAVMSGHVAQIFLDDVEWERTLTDLHRSLRPGGALSFESRDPRAEAWKRWTRERSLRVVDGVEYWHEVGAVNLPLVTYTTRTRHLTTGEQTSTTDTLAFRSESDLRASLSRTGFTVESVHGTWDGGPVTNDSPELILLARRADSQR